MASVLVCTWWAVTQSFEFWKTLRSYFLFTWNKSQSDQKELSNNSWLSNITRNGISRGWSPNNISLLWKWGLYFLTVAVKGCKLVFFTQGLIFHASWRNYWVTLIGFVVCGISEDLSLLIVVVVKLGTVTQSTTTSQVV